MYEGERRVLTYMNMNGVSFMARLQCVFICPVLNMDTVLFYMGKI